MPEHAMFKVVRRIIFYVSGFVIIAMLGSTWLADYLTFAPEKYPGPDQGSWNISDLSYPVEDHWIITPDKIRLHAWYLPNKKSNITILWLHGNAGNITGRLDQAITWADNLSVSVFLLSYRGYGRSEGNPSIKNLYQDTKTAYDYLSKLENTSSIVIYGHSLGGAAAIDLAVKASCDGLIIEGSFTSLVDIGKMFYPYLPVKWFVGDYLNSLDKIRGIDCPKLFIHGDQDEVIPYEMGRRLFEKAKEPKTFYRVKGGDHSSLLDIGGQEFLHQVRQFLSNVNGSGATDNHPFP
jgi:fermentation-respiration switch protein FrsA (DUF1100 family)